MTSSAVNINLIDIPFNLFKKHNYSHFKFLNVILWNRMKTAAFFGKFYLYSVYLLSA